MNIQAPLPAGVAALGVFRCMTQTLLLTAHHRLRCPSEHIGRELHFANGTSARVYRETVVDGGQPAHPCVLIVEFKLRLVRGQGHALFRRESVLNTPLFVGFPGFVSKLWLTHDQQGVYRGLYEWDGPARAECYARSLWQILRPVCVPGSVHYSVLPGLHRDEVLADPRLLEGAGAGVS